MTYNSKINLYPVNLLPHPAIDRSLSDQLNVALQQRDLCTVVTSWESLEANHQTVYIVLDAADEPLLCNPSIARFEKIKALLIRAKMVLWLTLRCSSEKPVTAKGALITGFARTARTENIDAKLMTVDVQDVIVYNQSRFAEQLATLVRRSFCLSDSKIQFEPEYIYRNNAFHIPRLLPNDRVNSLLKRATRNDKPEATLLRQKDRRLKLDVKSPGLIDSCRYVTDDGLPIDLKDFEVEVQVEIWALTPKILDKVLGRGEEVLPVLGECAGLVTQVGNAVQSALQVGDRVITRSVPTFGSHVITHERQTSKLPAVVSFSAAVAALYDLALVYHALVNVAQMTEGQSLIIHMGFLGLGRAAIAIAKCLGLEVFVLSRSNDERQYLRVHLNIADDNIIERRGMAQRVLHATQGRGVNTVLSSCGDSIGFETWSSIALLGVVISVQDRENKKQVRVPAEMLSRGITLASVDIDLISEVRPTELGDLVTKILTWIEAGTFEIDIPVKSLAISDIQGAFRSLKTFEQFEKFVLEVDDNSLVPALTPAIADFRLCKSATYVIVGGLGGLGRPIAKMMASIGAKYLVFLSRRALNVEQRQALENDFRSLGTKIMVVQCDISRKDQVEKVVSSHMAQLPPVRGVIQAAMVLKVRFLDKSFSSHQYLTSSRTSC